MDIHKLLLRIEVRNNENKLVKDILNIKPEELEDIIKGLGEESKNYYVTLDKSHEDDEEYENIKVKTIKK